MILESDCPFESVWESSSSRKRRKLVGNYPNGLSSIREESEMVRRIKLVQLPKRTKHSAVWRFNMPVE